jgi:hypothetical protein
MLAAWIVEGDLRANEKHALEAAGLLLDWKGRSVNGTANICIKRPRLRQAALCQALGGITVWPFDWITDRRRVCRVG